MTRAVSGVFILLGVVLLVAAGVGASRPGSGAFLVGVAALVVGVVMRIASPRGATSVGGGPAPISGPRRFEGRKVDATFSAADIVAQGHAATGRLRSASLTGRTAGEVAPHLSPEEARDPIVNLVFEYPGPTGSLLVKEALVRVPTDKVDRLAPGAELPVRYIVDSPEIAAIDWSRL